jgi:hypothetical protein
MKARTKAAIKAACRTKPVHTPRAVNREIIRIIAESIELIDFYY